MGIFDFIKKMFQEEETAEIKLAEVTNWLDSRNSVPGELEEIRAKFQEEKILLNQNIKKLNDAELMDSNIPERAKQMMKGNRTTYVQKVERFTDELELPENPDTVVEFHDSFQSQLAEFSKTTLRNYQIIQEFLGNESAAVADNIRKLEQHITQAKKLIGRSGIDRIATLKKKTNRILDMIQRKDVLGVEIVAFEEKIKIRKEKIEEISKKIEELRNSTAFREYSELIEKKNGLKKEINEMENQRFHYFSVINTALKKYERLSLDNKIIRKYVDDSLNALLEDKELRIVDILTRMKEAIITGKLELKDRKREKVLEALNKLDKSYFENFMFTYHEENEKFQHIKEEINGAEVKKYLDGLSETLEHEKRMVTENKEKLQELQEELENISAKDMIYRLSHEIEDSLGIKIKITI